MALEPESIPTPSNTSSSVFLPTVCLHSWWLIKAEKDFNGKLLAVAGYTSRERGAKRVFISAPIIKRHDLSTLETADGIYLIIIGFINELRTEENGFPYEVFNHFLLGFPPDWECYAANCFKEDTTCIDSRNILTSNEVEPKSPVTSIQSHGEINELPEQIVGESPSKRSKTLSANTESQGNAKKVVCGLARVETTKCNRKMTKSKSADPKREKKKSISADSPKESFSVKRSNKRINFDKHEKTSTISSELSNLRRSRSGRLLLPPLEFWRNQMPVYDADHSLTEIQESASVSPCRGSGAQSRKKQRQKGVDSSQRRRGRR